jgi:anti-sigma factor RsiW
MNRTDALTERLVDGTLTEAEAGELLALVEADPAARTRHLALVRLEATLRGLRTEFDLAAPTVAKIAADRLDRTTAAVMTELKTRRARASTGRKRFAAAIALAAAVLVAVWLGTRALDPGVDPPVPEVARLAAVSGTVEVVGPSGAVVARLGLVLDREQTVRTSGEDSTAVVEFPDRGRVEIHPESAVRFTPADGGEPWKVVLVEGRVTAFATGRRVVVGAGGADVDVGLGSFSVCSSGAGSARVESPGGDVRVVRGGPAEPVLLGPGGAAVVRDEEARVRVEAPRPPLDAPLDRLDFRGALDVSFADDGEVWAASAKQLVRWYPATVGLPAGVDRRLFAPPPSNDGVTARLSADLRTLVAFQGDAKDDRVKIRDLPGTAVRRVLPVRVTEARFLCVPPDASWVGTSDAANPSDPRTGYRVRVWDAGTGAERFARDWATRPLALAATPDGKWLAVEGAGSGRTADDRVLFLNAETGDEGFGLPTARRPVTAIGFSPDARLAAVGFNGLVQVWNLSDRQPVRTFDGFERVVSKLAFSPKGDLVAAGTHDGQVWVWAVGSGRRVQVIDTGTRNVRSLAFSPDGKRLVTATNRAGVALWPVAPEPAADPDA